MQDNYSENDPLIGKILGEKFKINKRLGAGGMATVYKATQINLGREVALKIIHPNLVNDNESISRFYREARDLATLSHPSIVTVYDFGTEEGYHYISMEYLQGKNLTEVIRQEGRLDELKIVKYIAPIADALNHLHENGLIHRDIKSSNIFISSNDRAVLMDFGIAFHQDKTISMSGAILGTVEYMSPEQARGDVIDGRSDIFSLGLVMYEAITGRVPFYSDNPTSTLYKVVHEPAPPIPDDIKVSKELKDLVLSTLEKDADQRPQNATIIYDILNSIVTLSEINRRKGQDEGRKGHEAKPSSQKASEKEKQKKAKTESVKDSTKSDTGKKSKVGIFLIIGLAVLILGAAGFYYFFMYGKKTGADTSQLIVKAKETLKANDYVSAYKFSSRIVANDPGNSEANQIINESKLKLFDTYITPSLVSVPSGTFVMGNDAGDDDTKPQHNVTVNSFRLSKTEITNKQFVMFLNALDCQPTGAIKEIQVIDLSKNKDIACENGTFKVSADAENLPVTGVTWSGADMFCRTFSGRLPTEAEWEYAACAGENFLYSGSNDLNEIAWYMDNSSGKLNNVGSKKPNAFGLFDMSGNAWEWCNDFYDPDYYKKAVAQNPTGPETGSNKVIRGGDFSSPREGLTNKYRFNDNAGNSTSERIGFRICFPGK
jgi:serine/threonine protein kinase